MGPTHIYGASCCCVWRNNLYAGEFKQWWWLVTDRPVGGWSHATLREVSLRIAIKGFGFYFGLNFFLKKSTWLISMNWCFTVLLRNLMPVDKRSTKSGFEHGAKGPLGPWSGWPAPLTNVKIAFKLSTKILWGLNIYNFFFFTKCKWSMDIFRMWELFVWICIL